MTRARWWERSELTVEGQVEAIEHAGLEFELDNELLHSAGIVVFRGQLRLEDRRSPAHVVYPPGFDLGEHPLVIAPDLDVGRHRSPNGLLCLDHSVLGESEPMSGAEAIERAERLWWLWAHDRAQLALEEADAPDPWANYVEHTPGTSLTMIDAEVEGAERGYLHFGLTSLYPLRGALQQLRVTHPAPAKLDVAEPNAVLRGSMELTAPWLRLPEHPPVADLAETVRWLHLDHRALADRAVRHAEALHGEHPQMPALIGFVYPDEGPQRGETHDAWLFVLVRPNRQVELPRPFLVRSDERWLRQPHLKGLGGAKAAVVGVGALGSQVANLLARAGVGELLLIDHDIVTPGNRTRHELDLGDLGRPKTLALADRLRRVNPWISVITREARLGTPFLGGATLHEVQRVDDEIAAQLGNCEVVVNATANSAASSYLSAIAADSETSTIHTYVSAGAWGARLLVQRPSRSACWDCLAWWQATAQEDRPPGVDVPELAEEHAREVVMELGCADPTFTGPGFELSAAAAATARGAVGLILNGDGYPAPDFDLATLRFRRDGEARAVAQYSSLPVHPECTSCRT